MNKLLIATSNHGKIEEYKRLLADSGLQLVTPKELGITEIPQETGKDFEENAIIKAKFYAKKSGLPALADDGGLVIDALVGQESLHTPGNATDEQILQMVVDRMAGIPPEKRQCTLGVAIALSTPFGIMTSFSDVPGIVADKPSKNRTPGLPYRSIVFLPNYGKYYCDLSDSEREILNHRKHALNKIKDMIVEISKE
jgi:XTP/dITP diphosphohydrolase